MCGSAAAPQPAGSPAGCVPRAGAPRSPLSRPPAALPAAAALQSLPCPSPLQASLKTHRNLQGRRENSCSAINSFLCMWGHRQTTSSRTAYTAYPGIKHQGNPFKQTQRAFPCSTTVYRPVRSGMQMPYHSSCFTLKLKRRVKAEKSL